MSKLHEKAIEPFGKQVSALLKNISSLQEQSENDTQKDAAPQQPKKSDYDEE